MLRFLRAFPAFAKPQWTDDSECDDIGDYADWVARYDTLTEAGRALIAERVAEMTNKPLISVVMPAYATPAHLLEAAIRSVIGQLYDHWELCVADDASPSPVVTDLLARLAREEPRIKWTRRAENGHISAASNSALALASGDFVALMDHDDILPAHALYEVAVEIAAHPDVDIIYSDEDKIDAEERRCEPYFKSDWNLELLLQQNMISHLGVYRRSLIEAIGGFRVGFEGSQDYDLVLRAAAATSEARIRHIPQVLYHWRADASQFSQDQLARCVGSAVRAKQDFLRSQGIDAAIETNPQLPYWERIRRRLPQPAPRTTLIVRAVGGTRAFAARLCQLVAQTVYAPLDIVVIGQRAYLATVARVATTCDNALSFRTTHRGLPYSVAANEAAREAAGDLVVFLSGDLTPVNAEWITEMVAAALPLSHGAVGARIVRPDGAVDNAGLVLSPSTGVLPLHPGGRDWQGGHLGRLHLSSYVTALGDACLCMRKSLFVDVGGFDAALGSFAGLDLCLKLDAEGYRMLWTPFASLVSHDAASRLAPPPSRSTQFTALKARWGERLAHDAFYNPNLALEDGRTFKLAFPPRGYG